MYASLCNIPGARSVYTVTLDTEMKMRVLSLPHSYLGEMHLSGDTQKNWLIWLLFHPSALDDIPTQ